MPALSAQWVELAPLVAVAEALAAISSLPSAQPPKAAPLGSGRGFWGRSSSSSNNSSSRSFLFSVKRAAMQQTS